MSEKFDFSGYATRNDLRCSDGRTIRRDAFKHNDGNEVPLVWQHMHDSPSNVIGKVLLKNRPDGVYAYGKFNSTENGKIAKTLVQHGDITALSIYANQLRQNGGDVLHGEIKEVSLVLAGANPGALIDFPILSHGEHAEEEAIIYTDSFFEHSDEFEVEFGEEKKDEEIKHEDAEQKPKEIKNEGENKMAEEKTVKDVFDSLTEEQKNVVYYMIGLAVEDAKGEKVEHSGEDNRMKYNCFDGGEDMRNTLSHSEIESIFGDIKRYGSLKDSVLAHSEEYGIENISYLFPEDRMVGDVQYIKRKDDWVSKVMGGVHHTPFSRIKSIMADITEEDARAKGYIKGNMKKEEFFRLIKRVTTPTTVYKKQKLDRDDMIDITDFDVVAMLKGEMRMMLDEELARAYLVGDGRDGSSDDKINELNIRPIWTDEDMFTIKTDVPLAVNVSDTARAKAFIKAVIKSRKNYRGSGKPSLFTTEDMVTDCLLMEDSTGRFIYENEEKLATLLRVKEIVTAPILENQVRTDTSAVDHTLMGLVVNLSDYTVGADKGGAVNMFDDFDIDYNQQKYLIETRCSGALTKPYSAIAIESTVQAG